MKKSILAAMFALSLMITALSITVFADIDNLAVGAAVSTNNPAEKKEYGIDKVCDGTSLSRYMAANPTEGEYSPTYITFDFGESIEFDTFELREYLANITNFKIEYSLDGSNWTLISERTKKTKAAAVLTRLNFNAVKTRYFRLCVTASEGNINIYEIVVKNNCQQVPPTRGKPVTESNYNEWGAWGCHVTNINDGDTTTRWVNPADTNEEFPHTITIDLGNEEKLNYYYMHEHIATLLEFSIEYSLDGKIWETAVHRVFDDENRGIYTEGEFETITARYVRLVMPCATDDCSLYEWEMKYAEDTPMAANVMIEKPVIDNTVLTGCYDYVHPAKHEEGESLYKWYCSDSKDGEYTEISGADKVTYTLTAEDCGKWIKFEVVPTALSTGAIGEAVQSKPVQVPNQILLGKIVLKNGVNTGYINKERREIKEGDYKCKVFSKDGVTYLPVRFISEALGAEVGYEDSHPTVLYNGVKKYLTDSVTSRDTAFVSSERIKEIFNTGVYINENGLVIIGDNVRNCYSDEIIKEISNTLEYHYDTETLKTTAESLFALIDFSDKSLAVIKSEYESGNYGKAMELYKERFVNKASKKYAPEMVAWCMQTDIEDIMNNIVVMNHPAGYVKMSLGEIGNIEWFQDSPAENTSWWTNISSMHFPYNFVEAFLENGDVKYMKRWALVWEDFAKNNYDAWLEAYNSTNATKHTAIGSTYMPPLHVSWKLGNFVSQLGAAARYSPQNTEAAIPGAYLASMIVRTIDYVDNLVANSASNDTPNQVIDAAISLVTANSFFEDFSVCKGYYDRGIEIINDYLTLLYLPDGADVEQSFNYNEALIEKAEEFKEMFAHDSVKPNFYDRLDEVIAYRTRMLKTLRFPDDVGPSLRNGNIGGKIPYNQMLKNFKIAVNGTENSELDFNSIQFPYGGFYSLRTDWTGDNAVNMFMKGSRKGSGHHDESGNALQLWAYGRELLADSGQSNYGTDFFEYYILSSFGANTISVDGYSQTMAAAAEPTTAYTDPIAARWLNTEKFDFTESFYDYGYGMTGDYSKKKLIVDDVTHNRQVIFDRESEIFVSTDIMKTDSEHDYTQVWAVNHEFTEDEFMINRNKNLIKTLDAEGANISIYNFNNENLDYETYCGVNENNGETVYGWQTYQSYGQKPKIDTHVKWKGAGNQLAISLIVPYPDMNDKVKATSKLELTDSYLTGFTAQLADGSQISYIASKNGKREIEIDGFKVNAEGIYIKKNKDGKITGIMLNADNAAYNGKTTDLKVSNFQFEIANGELVVADEVKIPEGFKWESNANGNNVPVYTK